MTELELLQSRIRTYMNDTSDHMSGGGCEDHSAYRYMCGMIKAFATIEREIIDIREKHEQS